MKLRSELDRAWVEMKKYRAILHRLEKQCKGEEREIRAALEAGAEIEGGGRIAR